MKSASEDDFTEFEFVDIEHSEEQEKNPVEAEHDVSPRQSCIISKAERIVEYFDPEPGHKPKRVIKPSVLTSASSTRHISVFPAPKKTSLTDDSNEEKNVSAGKECTEDGGVSKMVVATREERKPEISREGPQGTVTLEGNGLYCCKNCGTHVSLERSVESRAFQVGKGHFAESKRGYLFTTATNLRALVPCHEFFTTGRYKISYVECLKCETQLGWKYLESENVVGKAKIGKFCLRLSLLSFKAWIQYACRNQAWRSKLE